MSNRCEWARDPIHAKYHDDEWGDPVHNDRVFFEFLTLEGAQAGLSWLTVLKRRQGYREAFAHFDPVKVAQFKARDIKQLLANPGIIRHELKIKSTIANAKAFLRVQKEFGSFDKYIWQFVDGAPIVKRRKTLQDLPTSTVESDQMSRDLKRRGFSFVGTTICYAFMQACGLVSDHTDACYKRVKLS